MATMATIWRSMQRFGDRIFDAISARPIGIVVFACSAALLVHLELGMQASIRADAVASAQQVDHPARVDSFVAHVYVQPGDPVEAGAPLVDLSPHFIDRELGRIDTEIEKLLQEARLAQARLVVEEQGRQQRRGRESGEGDPVAEAQVTERLTEQGLGTETDSGGHPGAGRHVRELAPRELGEEPQGQAARGPRVQDHPGQHPRPLRPRRGAGEELEEGARHRTAQHGGQHLLVDRLPEQVAKARDVATRGQERGVERIHRCFRRAASGSRHPLGPLSGGAPSRRGAPGRRRAR